METIEVKNKEGIMDKGSTYKHSNGVSETPYFEGGDDGECVEVEFRGKRAGLEKPTRVSASEATLWCHLQWPDHFRGDGTCLCKDLPHL